MDGSAARAGEQREQPGGFAAEVGGLPPAAAGTRRGGDGPGSGDGGPFPSIVSQGAPSAARSAALHAYGNGRQRGASERIRGTASQPRRPTERRPKRA